MFDFEQDAAHEITAELQGFPDFIIGNYSDGNLVASLLAYKMGVTQVSNFSISFFILATSAIMLVSLNYNRYHISCMQCNIAHPLEKTKYQDSTYIGKSLMKYHFSCQFPHRKDLSTYVDEIWN